MSLYARDQAGGEVRWFEGEDDTGIEELDSAINGMKNAWGTIVDESGGPRLRPAEEKRYTIRVETSSSDIRLDIAKPVQINSTSPTAHLMPMF